MPIQSASSCYPIRTTNEGEILDTHRITDVLPKEMQQPDGIVFKGTLKGTLLNNWNNLHQRILNSGNSTTSPTYQSRNGTVPHGLRHAAEVQYAQGWEYKGTLLNNWNNLDQRILNTSNSTTSHSAYLLVTIDRKVDLQRRKKMVLDDLFRNTQGDVVE